jgi:hypothetical protein
LNHLKITSWNIEWLDKLIKPTLTADEKKRRDAIVNEITQLDADVMLILEGPQGEAKMKQVCKTLFNDKYQLVTHPEGDAGYDIQGEQWIWWLIRTGLFAGGNSLPFGEGRGGAASLLPVKTWYDYTGAKTWKVYYWGSAEGQEHSHYRTPQVLVLNYNGIRIELIGVHLKSKFVNGGETMWKKGGAQKQQYIIEALKARIKMATEASNIRDYITKRFAQTENPAIFVMGDFNDGPGKEYFEKQYLFFDLINNIQGSIFEADKFLNHALFDYAENLRWSTRFKDFVDPLADDHQLIDHILFTQGLVSWKLPVCIEPHAGKVEHEIHDLVNSTLPTRLKTSDHKPVSVMLSAKFQ